MSLDLDAIEAGVTTGAFALSKATALALVAEVRRQRARIDDYENCITWNVTCSGCARHLDIAIAEHERVDKMRDCIRFVASKLAEARIPYADVGWAVQQLRAAVGEATDGLP